ncbi:MAG: metal-sensing transcriptional repressor [Peptoniphilaceae bacterium]|nr:metal-sensing transcriptional repressor [Peptoniphilaceae bacterium]MDD7382891.1 metal-sensing transcriptional repressor [Peptoniphilaceae bacterium]MDY3738150.1 metal-sensing transcriptional repressor [Peptoniphilaceae bacterium]
MKADKEKLTRKLKTVRGQIEGLIKMIENDRYCIDISTQLMSSISILKNVNKEILESHLKNCLKDSISKNNSEDIDKKIEEIIQIIEKISK